MPESRISACYAIVGPTGVGKTALAVLLASTFDLEVIGVDSRQVYRYMDIGTGKPSKRQKELVKHHLVDVADPSETYSAGRFAREGRAAFEKVRRANRMPFLVGGTGLYLKALVEGLVNAPPSDPLIRAELYKEASEKGSEVLFERLKKFDQEAASRIHPNDLFRIVRALEIHHLTRNNFTALKQQSRPEPLNVTILGLHMNREFLYRRLENRVDKMIKEGFVEEVESLLQMGYDEHLCSMNGIGYRQLTNYIKGKIPLEEAIDSTKRETRNLAKRQMTWFRNTDGIIWIEVPPSGSLEGAAADVTRHIPGE